INGFRYSGIAGSGFTEKDLLKLTELLLPLRVEEPPCTGPDGGPPPSARGHIWVRPSLCCEVRFLQWTPDGVLRQPVFMRMRPDKRPEECVREAVVPADGDGHGDSDALAKGDIDAPTDLSAGTEEQAEADADTNAGAGTESDSPPQQNARRKKY